MYHSKIGANSSRIPNSEWSGCGFSKTYLNLFPTVADKTKTTEINGTTIETGNGVIAGPSSSNEDNDINNGDHENGHGHDDGGNNLSGPGAGRYGQIKTHHPHPHYSLGHQQSNLLDFGALRPDSDNPPTDLASLFIQNGLGKYIGKDIKYVRIKTLRKNRYVYT